ncbi:MAG: hypothetical protein AB7N76_22250 [Planctomycetota bacterium]
MSYEFYKLVHLIGVMLLFLSLGGLALLGQVGAAAAAEGKEDAAPAPPPLRKLLLLLHGVAMFLLLVAGFGALAKLGLGFPGWVYGKLAVWLLLGAAPALLRRKPELVKTMLLLMPLLGAVAAWLALNKPGG